MADRLALCLSDAHVQHGAWANRPSLCGDSLYSLQQIIAAARKYQVKAVIGAGDLIDRKRNEPLPINYWHNCLDQLERAGIPFYYIQGNHEQADPPWLSGHRWAKHLHKKTVELASLKIYGLDCCPAGVLQEELAAVPEGTDLLIAHQGWSEWLGLNYQGSLAEVHYANLLYTGDLHETKLEEHRNVQGDRLLACSSGATCMQAIDEPAECFFTWLMRDGTFLHERLKTRTFIDWSLLTRLDEVDQFASKIDAELEKARAQAERDELPDSLMTPLLRVSYLAKLTDVPRRVEKLVGNRAHLFWKEVLPEEKSTPGAHRAALDGVTPLTLLPRRFPPLEKPEQYNLAKRLLLAEDPKQEFRSWLAEKEEEA